MLSMNNTGRQYLTIPVFMGLAIGVLGLLAGALGWFWDADRARASSVGQIESRTAVVEERVDEIRSVVQANTLAVNRLRDSVSEVVRKIDRCETGLDMILREMRKGGG